MRTPRVWWCHFAMVLGSVGVLGCSATGAKRCLKGQNPDLGGPLEVQNIDDFKAVLVDRPCAVRRCEQKPNHWGQWVNHGRYWEFDAQDRTRLKGSYELGRPHGRFEIWDAAGRVIDVRYFNHGVPVDKAEQVENAFYSLQHDRRSVRSK